MDCVALCPPLVDSCKYTKQMVKKMYKSSKNQPKKTVQTKTTNGPTSRLVPGVPQHFSSEQTRMYQSSVPTCLLACYNNKTRSVSNRNFKFKFQMDLQ